MRIHLLLYGHVIRIYPMVRGAPAALYADSACPSHPHHHMPLLSILLVLLTFDNS